MRVALLPTSHVACFHHVHRHYLSFIYSISSDVKKCLQATKGLNMLLKKVFPQAMDKMED